MRFIIVDDGTLDTVVKCAACGWVERTHADAYEGMTDEERVESAMFYAHLHHEGDCPAEP